MIETLKKYRLMIIILSFVILATLVMFLLFIQSKEKIPLKGVYVMEGLEVLIK